jgi:hypothetical protein
MLGATETGVFDQQTREAVDRFQRQQGWEPSGVGPETWRRLDGHAGAPGHRPNLVEGDRGPGVRLLQRILGIQETGFFGSATRAAVDAFQRQQGWEPTGVGPETWKRLDKKSGDKVDRICKVKSFTKKFGNWDISWPAFYGSSTTIRLPIKFTLELAEGSSKADCHIYQQKKGLTSTKCEKEDESPNFEKDGPTWWDGKDWRGGGAAGWSGTTATFEDKPGFYRVKKDCYPLYWGGAGHQGNFEFQTKVANISETLVGTLHWGMLIDYPEAERGKHEHTA